MSSMTKAGSCVVSDYPVTQSPRNLDRDNYIEAVSCVTSTKRLHAWRHHPQAVPEPGGTPPGFLRRSADLTEAQVSDLTLDRPVLGSRRGDATARAVHVNQPMFSGAGDPIGPAEVPGSEEKE